MANRKPARFLFVSLFIATATNVQAQCEVFKSEINDLKEYELAVAQYTDSLKPVAEVAAFAAKFAEGKAQARRAEYFAGEALAAANEAVALASEAQYDAEVCGLKAVVTRAIDAESSAIDARDLVETAYANAKKAKYARNLGDLRYFMRKALEAAREASKAAEAATYAAADSFHSCTHSDTAAAGMN